MTLPKCVRPARRLAAVAIAAAMAGPSMPAQGQIEAGFRPPAVPLVVHDPYLSVWSVSDRLTDSWSVHWTGKNQAMCGMVRVDGAAYRFAGVQPGAAEAMGQVWVAVHPTRTEYVFRAGGVELGVTFLSPLLATDPDLLSRPISHVTLNAKSADGAKHRVQAYLDCSAEWAVNTPDQFVRWSRFRGDGLNILSFEAADQRVLGRAGDDVRIDWGAFFLAGPSGSGGDAVIAGHRACRDAFVRGGKLPAADDLRQPRAAGDDWPVASCAADLGEVGPGEASAETTFYIGYDDRGSIEYFGRKIKGWWTRSGATYAEILAASHHDHVAIAARCREFDQRLEADLAAVGGSKYATLAALAYRQCIAAHKLCADFDGSMLMFPKENFSNGCISTVDVIFPSAPLFLALNPGLLEAQLRPVLDYAKSGRWRFDFAPHDLGTYPQANGQVYGGGERDEANQMPVEESANMLILLGELAAARDNDGFTRPYLAQIDQWAEYLAKKGLDPENQLCTDDFAGHLAHNANLSAKAIVALGAYARLCRIGGREAEAQRFRGLADTFAAQWVTMASDGAADGHTRLAFDRSGTWSQKYNLYWDLLLDRPLFDRAVLSREAAYYMTKQNRFGVPLDSRETYAKLDFHAWIACLAVNREDSIALLEPLYQFAQATPDRVPLTDWYQTTDGRCVGFRARSVVGGVFAPLLLDRERVNAWRAVTRRP